MLYRVEQFGPVVVAAGASIVFWFYLPSWQATLPAGKSGLENALGPVFDLATFSAGSLFAIYVLALSRADGFLGRIFDTKTFHAFHRYVSRSILLNVLLFLWTAYLTVVGLGDVGDQTSLILISAWAGTTVWAFLTVARVVCIFLILVETKSSRRHRTPAE